MGEMTAIAAARLMVRVAPDVSMAPGPFRGSVICLAPGGCIETPGGQRRIEDLVPGERVLTCADGPQEILWTGRRRMTGARLFAMPHLRPVRLRAGALGPGLPNADLCVAPQHRVRLRAGADPVAVTDLVDGRSVRVEPGSQEVIQILIARAQVIRVNGLELESLPPSLSLVDSLDPSFCAALSKAAPAPAPVPDGAEGFVQRALTGPEAAMLRQGGDDAPPQDRGSGSRTERGSIRAAPRIGRWQGIDSPRGACISPPFPAP